MRARYSGPWFASGLFWLAMVLFALCPGNLVLGTSTGVAPSIQEQPAAASALETMDVTLKVTARGTPPLSYQWKKDGKDLKDKPGVRSDVLILDDVTVADSGRYSVVVSNGFGSASSAEATLVVGSPYAVDFVAGHLYEQGSADGPGPEARFLGAQGLTLDSNGSILVADFGNHTIRKITPSGDRKSVV